jgi:RecJ-like exonuclease
MTTGRIEADRFVIEARHHFTGAIIQMTGPTIGVLEDVTRTIDPGFVENLAREFAHFLGSKLGPHEGHAEVTTERVYTVKIPQDRIRDVVGPGGKVIRGIIEQTGVKIDAEDDGTVHVASNDPDAAQKALQIIGDLTATAEVGKTYLGKVVRIVDFGAFIEIFPGTNGLLHISEIAEDRVKEVRDELKEGDQILVKVLGIEGNKIKLSRKAVLKEQREKLSQAQAES